MLEEIKVMQEKNTFLGSGNWEAEEMRDWNVKSSGKGKSHEGNSWVEDFHIWWGGGDCGNCLLSPTPDSALSSGFSAHV